MHYRFSTLDDRANQRLDSEKTSSDIRDIPQRSQKTVTYSCLLDIRRDTTHDR